MCLQHTLYDSNRMVMVMVRVSLAEIRTPGLEVQVLLTLTTKNVALLLKG